MEIFKGRPYYKRKTVGDAQHKYSLDYTMSKVDKTASLYLDRMLTTKHVKDHYIVLFDQYTTEYKVLTTYYKIRESLRMLKLRLKALLFKNSLEATVESLKDVDPVRIRTWGEVGKHDELIEV